MPGKVNFPASKQWEQYIRFLEPSAFVPPPFSSRRIGIPQDWQSLYDLTVLVTDCSLPFVASLSTVDDIYAVLVGRIRAGLSLLRGFGRVECDNTPTIATLNIDLRKTPVVVDFAIAECAPPL